MSAARRALACAALAWWAAGPPLAIECGAATPARVVITVHPPRAFGYVVGDVVHESLRIETPAGVSLDASTLPRRGRIDAWLEVGGVSVSQTEAAVGSRYDVDIEYQIVNAPRELRTIALPGLGLGFAGPTGKTREVVGDAPINVAPLTTDLLRVGLEEMRPDAEPEPLAEREPRGRLAREATAAVLCALLFAAVRFGWRRGRPTRPFTEARAFLVRSRRRTDVAVDAEAYRDALRAVHRAFDIQAGRTLFWEDLPAFLERAAAPVDLRERTERFFAGSRAAFFAADSTPRAAGPSIADLIALCEAWRRAAEGR